MTIGDLRTIDNRFSIGQKEDYCINKQDHKLFKKIDKDGNGILSESEIVARRKQEAKTNTIIDIAVGIAGISALAIGIKLGLKHGLKPELLEKNKDLALILTSIGAGLTMGALVKQNCINAQQKVTQTYENEHKLYTNT